MKCNECGNEDTTLYYYTSDDPVYLCDECAQGVFCLACGTFTGGTEDIFIFGAYMCSECAGNHDLHPELYETEYDEDEYEDEF